MLPCVVKFDMFVVFSLMPGPLGSSCILVAQLSVQLFVFALL